MTDHGELLKWVAEELFGMTYIPAEETGQWTERGWEMFGQHGWQDKEGFIWLESNFTTWHGIGLVVEVMAKRDLYMDLDSGAKPGGIVAVNWRVAFWNAEMKSMMDISVWGPWDDLNDEGMYVMDEKPWFAVYGAARKAVEEDE